VKKYPILIKFYTLKHAGTITFENMKKKHNILKFQMAFKGAGPEVSLPLQAHPWPCPFDAFDSSCSCKQIKGIKRHKRQMKSQSDPRIRG